MNNTQSRKLASDILAKLQNKPVEAMQLLISIAVNQPTALISSALESSELSELKEHIKGKKEEYAYNKNYTLFERRVIKFAKDYGKISTIKFYRNISKTQLREAKEFVDTLETKAGIRFGTLTCISDDLDILAIKY